jgi:hypothetical protein
MINRQPRDKLSAQLKRYLCGRITNRELDDTGDDLPDDGAFAISEMVYLTYSDYPEFHAIGDKRVQGETRKMYERCILFLDSELEYEWPEWHPKPRPWFMWLRNLLSSGQAEMKTREAEATEDEAWRAVGDVEVWPFIRRQDYDNALRAPRRLPGDNQTPL